MFPKKTLIFLSFLILKTGISFSQTTDPYYQQIVNQVSYDTVLANLQHLESLGRKEPGTAALNLTAEWLISKYQSFGYTDIVIDTFQYSGNQLYNIIVTKPGNLNPPKYLIIDGHYDTYHGPGVNDNGSGVATILEIARLLSEVQTGVSIKFINFSAEEQGLIGSGHYVDETVVPTNMDILLVFNIDEVGGVAGMINNTITCERDEANPSANNAISWQYTDTLVNLTHLYSNLQTHISYAYGSDYVPFQMAGEIITGFYETNESPFIHSVNDRLNKMSPAYVTQISKAATGAALHFSHALPLFTGIELYSQAEKINIYPNPASRIVEWKIPGYTGAYILNVFDAAGILLARRFFNEDDACQIDVSSFKPGILAFTFVFLDFGADSQVVKIVKK